MDNLINITDLIKSTRKGITPKYVDSSDIIVLNQKCIRNNKIDYSFAQYHDANFSFSEDKELIIGDILINSTGKGTAGRCALVKELPEDKKVITDSHILIVRTTDFYTAGCLEYSLFNIETLLQTFMDGSTGQGEFDKEILFNILLKLPKESARKDVYELLNTIDKKIENNNKIAVELENLAKTIYDYWFLQFDFQDRERKPYKSSGGKMKYNEALKRELPDEWEVEKLAKLTSVIRRGISPKYTEQGGISVLNQKCIRDQRVSFNDARRHKVILKDGDERLLKKFDIVINSTGVGTLGRVAYIKRLVESKTTIDSHVTIVRANPELISPQYLAWSLMRFQPVIEAAANGSTGQVELSKVFLEDIDIIIPPASIIQKFNDFVSPIISSLANTEKENEQLISLRSFLLPLLMDGQVEVN